MLEYTTISGPVRGLGDVVCDDACQLCYSTGKECPGGQNPFTCPPGYVGDDEGSCIKTGVIPGVVDIPDPCNDPAYAIANPSWCPTGTTPKPTPAESGSALDWLKNVGSNLWKTVTGQGTTPTPGTSPYVPPTETPIYKQPVFWIVGGVGVLALVMLTRKPKKKQPEIMVE